MFYICKVYNLIKRNDFYQTTKKIIGIYIIKCGPHYYVGSSINLSSRLRAHRGSLIRKKHYNNYFQNTFNKYQTLEFDILETFTTISKKDLLIVESNWVKKLKPALNLDDPLKTGGNHQSKQVGQFDKETGKLIKIWESPIKVQEELNYSKYVISSCANKNVKHSKSAYGFLWSYDLTKTPKYICNTGNNLIKKKVNLLEEGKVLKTFNSITDSAKFLKQYLNYNGNYKTFRANLWVSIKKGWKVQGKYTLEYA